MIRLNAAEKSAWMKNVRARVRTPKDRYRSDLERDWATVLEAMKRDGQLLQWHYEAVRLHLGTEAWFKPDFMLVWHDGEVSFDEVKGHMREAAYVRLKVAADRYPFRFRIVRRGKRGEPSWAIEEISAS